MAGSIAGTLAALVSVWVYTNPWPAVGWVTPNQMDEHIVAEAEDRKQLKAGLETILLLFDCVEWEEQLDQALHEQADGSDDPALEEEIRRLRKKIDDNDCDQFDE